MALVMIYRQLSVPTWIVAVVLIISMFLRIVLIFSGGQYFWPDEGRYLQSGIAVDYFFSGHYIQAFNALQFADHFLFKIIMVLPALLEKTISPNPQIPALFLGSASVLNIWLFWRISLLVAKNEGEALWAVVLFASTSTYFYYCRHLLPYDLAMMFGFISLLFALKENSTTSDSLFCGLFSAISFLTYNGYWMLAVFTLLIHYIYSFCTIPQTIWRILLSFVGFFTPMIVIFGINTALTGNMLKQFISFSATVIQGDFDEGWSLPIAYLWHSEHFFLLVWCAAIVYCLWEILHGVRERSVLFGLTGLVFMYGLLATFSVFLHQFVVYGRLVRLCVPFCCIVTAHGIVKMQKSNLLGEKTFMVFCMIGVVQVIANMYQPLTQRFPDEFRKKAQHVIAATRVASWELYNVEHIYPEPRVSFRENIEILLNEAHPQQYLPYQYEELTPIQRQRLRSMDISMKLVSVKQGNESALNDINRLKLLKRELALNPVVDLQLILAAAESGNAIAQNDLGSLYTDGVAVSQNYVEAEKWFRKAAEQGVGLAQNNLGKLYYFGNGVQQDYREAAKWFDKAVDQWIPESLLLLGKMYAAGEGVLQNDHQALKFVRWAVESDHPASKCVLANFYGNGIAVPRDAVLARQYCQECEKETEGEYCNPEWIRY